MDDVSAQDPIKLYELVNL